MPKTPEKKSIEKDKRWRRHLESEAHQARVS